MNTRRRFHAGIFAAAVAAGLSLAGTVGHARDLTDDPDKSLATANSDTSYWTIERMRSARPLPMPKFDAAKLARAVVLDERKASKTGRGFKPKTRVVPAAPGPRLSLLEGEYTANARGAKAISSGGYPFTTSRVAPKVAVTSWPYRVAGKNILSRPAKRQELRMFGRYLRPAPDSDRRSLCL